VPKVAAEAPVAQLPLLKLRERQRGNSTKKPEANGKTNPLAFLCALFACPENRNGRDGGARSKDLGREELIVQKFRTEVHKKASGNIRYAGEDLVEGATI
jgi:hypothetical protein